MTVSVVTCLVLALVAVASAENAVPDSVPAAITVYRNPEFFRNLPPNGETDYAYEEGGNRGLAEEYRHPEAPDPPAAPDFDAYYDAYNPREAVKDEDEPAEEHDDENQVTEETDEEHEAQEQTDKSDHDDKYNVRLDEDLYPREGSKLYEYSKEYYNPFFGKGMKSFEYPESYEELDSYEQDEGDGEAEEERKAPAPAPGSPVQDRKKGTREYLRNPSAEEIVEPRRRRNNVHADSKHVIRTISKIGFHGVHALSPVLYLPKIKAMYKFHFKPKKHHHLKWRVLREIPDDSAYHLSSHYDSDFEFF